MSTVIGLTLPRLGFFENGRTEGGGLWYIFEGHFVLVSSYQDLPNLLLYQRNIDIIVKNYRS